MKYYFIFGEIPVAQYSWGMEEIDFESGILHVHDDEKDSTIDLLCAYDGWDNWVGITEEEYEKYSKQIEK